MLTHEDVREHDIIDSYLAGRLSDADREAFEAHYFECDECFAEVEVAERLRAGIRAVERGATRTQRPRSGGSGRLAWLALAATIALAVASGVIVRSQLAASRAELQLARARTTELQRDLDDARRRVRETTAAAAPVAEANVALAILQATRSSASATPVNVPAGAARFIVWIEDPPPPTAAMAMILTSADGRALHRVVGVRPNAYGALVAAFPAAGVAPGLYRVTVTSEDGARVLARYDLSITRRER